MSAQVSQSGFESRVPNPASRELTLRRGADVAFQALALLVLVVALTSLATLIWDIVVDGAGTVSWNFITGFSSRRASQAGIWHALTGSIFVIIVTALIAVPIGVAAAIYLEEYGGRSMAGPSRAQDTTRSASLQWGQHGRFEWYRHQEPR